MIVGLCGAAGSGKDAVASFLVERDWTRLAFADPLKSLALAIDPWISHPEHGGKIRLSSLVRNWGWERAKNELPEVRKFLQDLGVGVREYVGVYSWVNAMYGAMLRVYRDDPYRNIVVTDVRFPNEAEGIRGWGGCLVRVQRPGHVNAAGQHAGHVSETALADIEPDFILLNDGDLDDLKRETLLMFGGLG